MQSIRTVDELRQFVRETLCARHDLVLGQFPMLESPLTRAGKPCGILFSQLGPRLMRVTAVWDWQHRVVVFYDSAGERFRKELLTDCELAAA